MSEYSTEFEKTLEAALRFAAKHRLEFAETEHLLLALTLDRDALEAFQACGVDIEAIEKNIVKHLHDNSEALIVKTTVPDSYIPKTTIEFQRVMTRASIHAQASGRNVINGANVLVSIFSEKDSFSNLALTEQGMTRFDLVNWISHGIKTHPHDIAKMANLNKSEKESILFREKEKAIKSAKKNILANKPNYIALSKALSRLAELEIKELNSYLPNSEEKLEAKIAQIQLMVIFFEGFKLIAMNLQEINKINSEKEAINKAAKSVVSLPEALNKWWENNNQKVISFSIGSPVTVGAFAVMKGLGVGPYAEAIITGATASYWMGSGVVKDAIAAAKSLKTDQK